VRPEACTNIDVGIGLPAAVRGIAAGALVGSDLHEPLLAIGADCVGVAGGLLHRNSGEENGWDVVLVGGLVEGIKVLTAGVVGVAGPVEDVAEVLGDHLIDGELGRIPATALDTTVEPIDRAIGTTRFGGIGCSANIAAGTCDVDDTRLGLRWRVVRRRRGGRGRRLVRRGSRSRRLLLSRGRCGRSWVSDLWRGS
jgi:hypothetical protein